MRRVAVSLVLLVFGLGGYGVYQTVRSPPVAPPSGSLTTPADATRTAASRADAPQVVAPPPAAASESCDQRYLTLLRSITNADPSASDEELQARWTERNARVVAQLAASDDPRQWISAMRLQEAPVTPKQIERLAIAVADNPDDPVLAAELFDFCIGADAPDGCARTDPVGALLRTDAGNGHTWVRLAVHHALAGRDDEALQALERVATAPEHSTRTAQTLSRIELDLRTASSSMTYFERFFVAIGGVAREKVLPYSRLFSRCVALTPTSPRWRWACTSAAQRIANDSSSAMQTTVGLSLLASVHQAAGETQQSEAALAEANQLRTVFQRQQDLDANSLLMTDSKVLERYIDAWTVRGEMAAQEVLIELTEAAIERGHFEPCID